VRLRFDFADGDGALGYLRGRTFSLDPAEVWFMKDFK
jgi:hypothetical protein